MSKLMHHRHGGRCTYCDRRTQDTSRPRSALTATREHVLPKSKGGTAWVLACRLCNELKGDLLPAQWSTFMYMHPRWWRSFTTNAQVKAALQRLETGWSHD